MRLVRALAMVRLRRPSGTWVQMGDSNMGLKPHAIVQNPYGIKKRIPSGSLGFNERATDLESIILSPKALAFKPGVFIPDWTGNNSQPRKERRTSS